MAAADWEDLLGSDGDDDGAGDDRTPVIGDQPEGQFADVDHEVPVSDPPGDATDGDDKILAEGQFAGATIWEGTQLEKAGLEMADLASLTEAEITEVTGRPLSEGLREIREAAAVDLEDKVKKERKRKPGGDARKIFPDKQAGLPRGVKAKKAGVDRWLMGPWDPMRDTWAMVNS